MLLLRKKWHLPVTSASLVAVQALHENANCYWCTVEECPCSPNIGKPETIITKVVWRSTHTIVNIYRLLRLETAYIEVCQNYSATELHLLILPPICHVADTWVINANTNRKLVEWMRPATRVPATRYTYRDFSAGIPGTPVVGKSIY